MEDDVIPASIKQDQPTKVEEGMMDVSLWYFSDIFKLY